MKKSTGIILLSIAGVAVIVLCFLLYINPLKNNSLKEEKSSVLPSGQPTATMPGGSSVPPTSGASSPGVKTEEVGGVEYKTGKDLAWPSEQIGGIERPASGKLTAVTTAKEKNTISLTIEGVNGPEVSGYVDKLAQMFPENMVTDNSSHGITFKGYNHEISAEFLYDSASATIIMKVVK